MTSNDKSKIIIEALIQDASQQLMAQNTLILISYSNYAAVIKIAFCTLLIKGINLVKHLTSMSMFWKNVFIDWGAHTNVRPKSECCEWETD